MNTFLEPALTCAEKTNPNVALSTGRKTGLFKRLHEISPEVFVRTNLEHDYAARNRGVFLAHHIARTLDESLNPDDYIYDLTDVTGSTLLSEPEDAIVLARTGTMEFAETEIDDLAKAIFVVVDEDEQHLDSFIDGFRAYFALAKQTSEKQV